MSTRCPIPTRPGTDSLLTLLHPLCTASVGRLRSRRSPWRTCPNLGCALHLPVGPDPPFHPLRQPRLCSPSEEMGKKFRRTRLKSGLAYCYVFSAACWVSCWDPSIPGQHFLIVCVCVCLCLCHLDTIGVWKPADVTLG